MRFACLAALILSLWAGPVAAQQDGIGLIKTLKADAFVTRGGQRSPAAVGDRLFQGDRLETGENGAMGVTFVDDTTLSLGPKSQITLTAFVFEPNADRYAFATNIVTGTFMFISGVIARVSPQSVAVQTPVGSIGIRGTRFLVKVEP